MLFDLDGTLTDSREGIFNSVRYSLDKLGRPCPPYETLLRFVGPPLHDSFERYCGMDAQESHRAVNVFRERYETIGWAENKAAPGMVELMRCLKEQGRTLAVASSKPERSVVPHCGEVWLSALFGRRLRQRWEKRSENRCDPQSLRPVGDRWRETETDGDGG